MNMKKVMLLSAATLAMMLSACNNSSTSGEKAGTADSPNSSATNTSQVFNLDTSTLASGATFYQCEMDHEVISDKAGECPTCGMELTELKKQ